MKITIKTRLQLTIATLLLCSTPSYAQEKQQQELAQLQQQIQLTERQVKQQLKQLEQAEQKLQQSDRALAEAANATRQTEAEKSELVSEERRLAAQQSELESKLKLQRSLLAAQLKSAYSLGQHDYSKMLLNQQDTRKLERVLSYYQYFNRARLKQLADLNNTITDLQQVLADLSTKQQQLSATLLVLQQQQQQLTQAKSKQQQAVASLQNTLKQQGRQLEYLKQNEASLQTTLEQLRELAEKARELIGLAKDKGKLTWPVKGSLLQRFGESRQGGISSRGILIQSPEGVSVKAIADGQVIYADWLKGYGWVIVLDHGAGFMSLYGHNQSLLKQPGSRINAGETIAHAGMSGGQAMPGLYFEIREKGEAVNPLQWLNKN